jgi:hypothetical protein
MPTHTSQPLLWVRIHPDALRLVYGQQTQLS